MWYLLRFPNGATKKVESAQAITKGKIVWMRKPADALVRRDGFLGIGDSYERYKALDKFDVIEETINGQFAEIGVVDLEYIDERPELSPGG